MAEDITVSAALEATPSAQAHGKLLHFPPAVLWLVPLNDPHPPLFAPRNDYVLLQKNKMFTPHLLVVPVGSSVAFPNRDPFFHNVFSLFDGKRFDLGLYEAGKTRYVTFSREGVSYIFCNIHPEMSAVVIALTTPLYSVADAKGGFVIKGVSAGDYELHLWVEGESQASIDRWVKTVHVSTSDSHLGPFLIPEERPHAPHTNKFDQPYGPEANPSY